jgi:hypothetical protein
MSKINRRRFVTGLTLGAAAMAAGPLGMTEFAAHGQSPVVSGSGLAARTFHPLPLGTIQPEGWLRRQLTLQANSLTGHLDEFWPDVGQSQWFGGKAEGWERAPYWLDGYIPLAWSLGDARMQARARRYVDHIVANQRPDGWYAPYPLDASAKKYDLWSILLVNKALVQYHEATGDDAVLKAVSKNLKAFLGTLDKTPLYDWGRFRWYEGLVSVYYVYEKTGESWLLDLARKLRQQGFDFMAYCNGEEVKIPTGRRAKWTWEKHGVNLAMAVKAYALASLVSLKAEDKSYPSKMLSILDQFHGQATGVFSADECLAGLSPVQGTELCAVVELMYSLEQVISVNGEAALGDRLEKLAFNALPATMSPDMWSHQYDQQVNQVQCIVNPDYQWGTNEGESNLFGLEPNFGCCTANLHQGWPKFANSLWMGASEEGIAAVAYAPSSFAFKPHGVPVSVQEETDYPFRDRVRLTIKADKAVKFPLFLRVPGWAAGASLTVGKGPKISLKPGEFHRLDREWNGVESVVLHFPMKARTERRFRGAITLERGPLLYSLALGEKWIRIHEDKPLRELPHADYEVRPTTPWNYGLILDEARPESSISFKEAPVGEMPFALPGGGMTAQVKGRLLPDWKLEHGSAAEVPTGEMASSEPVVPLTLRPYGCSRLRITEFPLLKK